MGIDDIPDKLKYIAKDYRVSKGENKARFCADPDAAIVIINALALNAMTVGIACIYYGSEQCFDGNGKGDGADRHL